MATVSSEDDLINTREVINRIEELEDEWRTDDGDVLPDGSWNADDLAEVTGLRRLLAEVSELTREDVADGVTLVRGSYVVDWIREEWHEIGPELSEYNPKTFRHEVIGRKELFGREPFCFIDWERASEDRVRHHMAEVEFEGVTYHFDQ